MFCHMWFIFCTVIAECVYMLYVSIMVSDFVSKFQFNRRKDLHLKPSKWNYIVLTNVFMPLSCYAMLTKVCIMNSLHGVIKRFLKGFRVLF